MPHKTALSLAWVLLLFLGVSGCDFVEEVWSSLGGELDVQKLGEIHHPELTEPSGIEKSKRFPGVYWTHNDSENPPQLFAIDTTGNVLAVFDVDGAENEDWEDLTSDDSGYLYIADTGDNYHERSHLAIYKIREPNPAKGGGKVRVEKAFLLRYPDGLKYDCEALFFYAGRLWLLTKSRSFTDSTAWFRFEPDRATADTTVLELVGYRPDVNLVTAADYSPRRNKLAILSYTHIVVLAGDALNPESASKILASRVPFVAGEAVCWSANHLIVLTERGTIYMIQSYRL